MGQWSKQYEIFIYSFSVIYDTIIEGCRTLRGDILKLSIIGRIGV